MILKFTSRHGVFLSRQHQQSEERIGKIIDSVKSLERMLRGIDLLAQIDPETINA